MVFKSNKGQMTVLKRPMKCELSLPHAKNRSEQADTEGSALMLWSATGTTPMASSRSSKREMTPRSPVWVEAYLRSIWPLCKSKEFSPLRPQSLSQANDHFRRAGLSIRRAPIGTATTSSNTD